MSQKKTKAPAKSEKVKDKDESSIRNSPATRALRFLLGKETPSPVEVKPDLSAVTASDQVDRDDRIDLNL